MSGSGGGFVGGTGGFRRAGHRRFYHPPMDPNQRIAQFEAMVRPEADPNNDMAWFSLGSAYRDAGRHADAAKAFARS
ncbi:MAG: hypothetical protein L6Q35_14570, partial [Phycisphaerales bacterium]|nr:hypothetical protein [Phycisphaerales bacterium]